MSNVILGIAGVVLFIGLAIAGAIYFGDAFSDANSNARGATVMQEIGQVAAAVDMYQARTRLDFPSNGSNAGLLDSYLRSKPKNPIPSGGDTDYVQADGTQGTTTAYVIMTNSATTDAAGVCAAVGKTLNMTGATGTAPIAAASPPTDTTAGCYKSTAGWGIVGAGTIVWYKAV